MLVRRLDSLDQNKMHGPYRKHLIQHHMAQQLTATELADRLEIATPCNVEKTTTFLEVSNKGITDLIQSDANEVTALP